VRTPFTQQHEILSENTGTRDSKVSCGENPKSLSHIVLEWYQVVTGTMTDTMTELL